MKRSVDYQPRCAHPGCENKARPRASERGPAPTKCEQHRSTAYVPSPPRDTTPRDTTPAPAPPPPAPRPAPAPPPNLSPLLQHVRSALLAVVTTARQGVKLQAKPRAALMAELRACGREVQRAITLLTRGASPWVCPSCGPLVDEPVHGLDEAMHCPHDGCDEVVHVPGIEPQAGEPGDGKGKEPGHAYRGPAGTIRPAPKAWPR